jgi:protein gp37
MGENSKIEWTDHTFNPWMGCTKVSPACDGCYAEAMMDHRYGKVKWGPHGDRVRTAPSNWKQPIRWDKEAKAAGTRPRVFCGSLADVFDNQVPLEWRHDLFNLIQATPNLVWLLLTKRPQNIVKMVKQSGCVAGNGTRYLPSNAAIGTTVEDQERADLNIPALLDAKYDLGPAFAFLSCEPLLGGIDLERVTVRVAGEPAAWRHYVNALTGEVFDDASGTIDGAYEAGQAPKIDWVIAGGETDQGKHKARPTHPDWIRALRDQCAAAGTAFHFKQNGEWISETVAGTEVEMADLAPNQAVAWGDGATNHVRYTKVGKKIAGRLLDGIEHNGFPQVSA